MSDTPRTDCEQRECASRRYGEEWRPVSADFARTLERELAAANARSDEWKRLALLGDDEVRSKLAEERAKTQKMAIPKSVADGLAEALAVHIITYPHSPPNDCFATGPLTGDPIQDYVSCPGCRAAKMADAVLTAYREATKP